MWRLTSSRRKHREHSPSRQARTSYCAPFVCFEINRKIARWCVRQQLSSHLFVEAEPTGGEEKLYAVEGVPHGRSRPETRVVSASGCEVHQIVVGGLYEARQAPFTSLAALELALKSVIKGHAGWCFFNTT